MTYFEHNGKHYVIWADIIGQSALYMQEINPTNLGKARKSYHAYNSGIRMGA